MSFVLWMKHPLFCSGIEGSPFFRSLESAQPSDLRRGWGHILPEGPLRGRVTGVLDFLIWVIAIEPLGSRLLLHLLLFPSLFLAKELLGLQHHPGIEAVPAQVAISGALVAGVPEALLGTLEAFPRRVVLLPRILGDRAGIFPALPKKQNQRSVWDWEKGKAKKRREGVRGYMHFNISTNSIVLQALYWGLEEENVTVSKLKSQTSEQTRAKQERELTNSYSETGSAFYCLGRFCLFYLGNIYLLQFRHIGKML